MDANGTLNNPIGHSLVGTKRGHRRGQTEESLRRTAVLNNRQELSVILRFLLDKTPPRWSMNRANSASLRTFPSWPVSTLPWKRKCSFPSAASSDPPGSDCENQGSHSALHLRSASPPCTKQHLPQSASAMHTNDRQIPELATALRPREQAIVGSVTRCLESHRG